MTKIKFFVMDVDGTLTNGKIYMGQEGEIAKAFDIKDGCGILLLLPKYDIVPIIITARRSRILEKRCEELGIKELHQGVGDKLAELRCIVGSRGEKMDSVAYVGDDLPDIASMQEVKRAGGLVFCPADAIPEIKAMADYVSPYKAGEGAVRDIIHYLGGRGGARDVQAKIDELLTVILSKDFSDQAAGEYRLEDGTKYTIQEYQTKDESECVLESHRGHIDIQYMLDGTEVFKLFAPDCLNAAGAYDAERDVEYWENGLTTSRSILVPGSVMVVNKGQPHKGAIKNGVCGRVRKLVCKVDVK